MKLKEARHTEEHIDWFDGKVCVATYTATYSGAVRTHTLDTFRAIVAAANREEKLREALIRIRGETESVVMSEALIREIATAALKEEG